jgi:hypothetical protein
MTFGQWKKTPTNYVCPLCKKNLIFENGGWEKEGERLWFYCYISWTVAK